MGKKNSSFVAKARASSLATQEDFAKGLGVTSVTLSKWENDPDRWFTAERLRWYWEHVGDDGREYLKRYVQGIFN